MSAYHVPTWLKRNIPALQPDQQRRLARARVLVCGCGGLGGLVIENLVRMGTGNLVLFDPDTFSPSNLNRQLGALNDTLGQNKALTLAARMKQISAHCSIEAHPLDFRTTDQPDGVDLVIDCLDNRAGRLELARRCQRRGLFLVHGAVNGWCGQLWVQAPGVSCPPFLFGHKEQEHPTSVLACTVSLIASLQAAEAIKLLLSQTSSYEKDMLYIDLFSAETALLPIEESGNPS